MAQTAFERKICDYLTGTTGRRIAGRDLLVWSIDKTWIEKLHMPDEDLIFLEALEVWCLVRRKKKGSAKCVFN